MSKRSNCTQLSWSQCATYRSLGPEDLFVLSHWSDAHRQMEKYSVQNWKKSNWHCWRTAPQIPWFKDTPERELSKEQRNFILFSCFGRCQAVSEIIRNILLDLSLLLSVGPVLGPLETENDARICELIPSLLSLPRKDFSSVSLALCNSCLVAKFSYLDLW